MFNPQIFPLSEQLTSDEETPRGVCSHCGEEYFTVSEEHMHEGDLACIGGDDRFDTREEYEGEW